MSNYRNIAARFARAYGLNPAIFLRQIGAESGFNPGARSGAGAVGIAQIVPRYHPDVDPTRPGNQAPGQDPVADLRYAAQLDRSLLHKYGTVRDMLSAYNSGRPWAQGQGIAETRGYVSKILGGTGSGGGSAAAPPPDSTLPALGGPSPQRQFSLGLMDSVKHHDLAQMVDAVKQFKAAQDAAAATPAATHGGGGGDTGGTSFQVGGGSGGLKELIYDPLGSIFDGHPSNKPYGGHTDHVHVADANPRQQLAIINHALKMGLRVSENPYVDHVDPVHANHSWHYRVFKRMFNGKQLGMAEDVSGNAQRMAAFFRWVAANYG